eukprot:gnl/TRDRNA2_/TRDRNA2_150949_c0_seq4.p1 gnl/TRDRNA2_/TRDRNA2_150949_c0~~gnl/TRDRNA2_/TRDRNA2_150949_c0_seq4.p1  ORF type:complete len:145 (-),score=19.84 gnl/TRDRNA2_/TRDRNA2_150949_c0_seq4:226-660(-)
MAGQSEMPVFISLARVMQQRVREFNTQDLSNTAWAFSTTGRWEVSLFAALAEAVTQRVREFHKKIFLVTYWALSRYERLRDVWGCFELSRDTVLAMPLCGGLLLMECEQRGLIQQAKRASMLPTQVSRRPQDGRQPCVMLRRSC